MSNDRDDRNDEQEGRGDDRIATTTRDLSATTSREPMLPSKDGKDPAEVKLAPPKGEGGHKDGVVAETFKEPKGHETGNIDRVGAGPGQALHDDLASPFDEVDRTETLFDSPSVIIDPNQGTTGGAGDGWSNLPGGTPDTSQRETSQESPIDMSGPGGTGGSSGGKPGGSKPGGYDKPGKDSFDKSVDIGSKEAAKSGASQAKDTDNSLKWNKEWEKKDAAIREAAAKAKADADAKATAEAEATAGADATVDTEQDSGGSNDGAPDEAPVDPFGDDPDAVLVQPTEPEYDGPQGISGAQTEAFKNEFLQSQWNARQGSTVNPNPTAEGPLPEVEMLHTMDDMVTTPTDPHAAGSPTVKVDGPLVGGNQPIDLGPDHFEEGGGDGPYDDNLKGDFLYKVPKVPQSTGGSAGGADADDDTVDDDATADGNTNKRTSDADGPTEKMSSEARETSGVHRADLVDEMDRNPGHEHISHADVVSGGETVITRGGGDALVVADDSIDAPDPGDSGQDESGQDESDDAAGSSRFDHAATATGGPDASIEQFGAGEVLEPQPAFGTGHVATETEQAALDASALDPALLGRAGATTDGGSTSDDGTTITAIDVGPTTDLVTSRDTDEDEDDTMEYDPGLEPIE